MKRVALISVLACIAVLAIAATAQATRFGSNQILHFEGYGPHSWNKYGGDSPHDRNARSLRIHVGDPSAGEYVAAYSDRSLSIAKDAESVSNLSFEFREDRHVGAGAPRISVEFQNGDVGYLSALYCNHSMAITGGVWGRADFTRFHHNCTMFVTGETSGQYDADGSHSVWEVYTLANPDQILERSYFVADEEGNYRIDRLSLGAGVMYTSGNRRGQICTTESSC